ncbi:MAG: RDD family protein [bacterium]|nr:RDD family protein [bacterium]
MENPTKAEISSSQSSSSVNGWYKATVIRRWLASIVDVLIVIPAAAVLSLLLFPGKIENNNFSTILFFAYNVFFVWKSGATIGKKLLKVQVVNENYQPITFWQALIRETVGKFISTLVFSLGYFWAIWDKNRQTWHDKLAKTYVVTKIPNNGKNSAGTLIVIGLFLAIPIIAILAAVVVLVINPVELTKRGRDAARLSDLANIQLALQSARLEASPDDQNFFCGGQQPPCEGNSSLDGEGWVRVDFSKVRNRTLTTVPVDPTNSGENYYRYCSDGVNWELNTTLESQQQQSKAANDKGDNANLYEVGSDLTLCK